MYGEGISYLGELVDLGVKSGVVEKSGSWYSYGSERIGQGRENAKAYLSENQKIADEIGRAVKKSSGLEGIEDDGQTENKEPAVNSD